MDKSICKTYKFIKVFEYFNSQYTQVNDHIWHHMHLDFFNIIIIDGLEYMTIIINIITHKK